MNFKLIYIISLKSIKIKGIIFFKKNAFSHMVASINDEKAIK